MFQLSPYFHHDLQPHSPVKLIPQIPIPLFINLNSSPLNPPHRPIRNHCPHIPRSSASTGRFSPTAHKATQPHHLYPLSLYPHKPPHPYSAIPASPPPFVPTAPATRPPDHHTTSDPGTRSSRSPATHKQYSSHIALSPHTKIHHFPHKIIQQNHLCPYLSTPINHPHPNTVPFTRPQPLVPYPQAIGNTVSSPTAHRQYSAHITLSPHTKSHHCPHKTIQQNRLCPYLSTSINSPISTPHLSPICSY